MATIGEIAVNLIAKTAGFDAGLNKAKRSLGAFQSTAMGVASTIAGMVGIGGGFAGFGFAAKLAADAEQSTVAIENMTKSMEVTKQLLADINQFSTATPFEPTELRDAAQKLLSFNFSAGEIMPTLKTLGDVAAGSGKPLNEFVNILGKVRDRGKVTAETLSEFGIRSASIMDSLAKHLGVARGEVVKLASTGQISFSDLTEALKMMTSEGGLFAGAMEKQSKTLAGRWSTLTGNVKLLAENIGTLLLPALGKIVDLGNAMLGWLMSVDQSTIQLSLAFGGGVAAMITLVKVIPLVVSGFQAINTVIRTTILSQTMLTALSGPAAWVKIGAAIAVTAAATGAFYKVLDAANDKTASLASNMQAVADKTEDAAKQLVRYSKLQSSTQSAGAQSQRRRDELNAIHGTPIVARSLMPGSRGQESVVDKIQESNELLKNIELNTRNGLEINEVDL